MTTLRVNKVAVVSDIHGNADALKATLKDLKSKHVDETVFLGDFLTYGCQPLEVLELIQDYVSSFQSVCIKGNHDQLYFDYQAIGTLNGYSPPDFVRESIDWTCTRLQGVCLEKEFHWLDDYRLMNVYFSHANPFNYGDWRYLESENNLLDAFAALDEKNCSHGVFGHSHRPRIFKSTDNQIIKLARRQLNVEKGHGYIFNAGSVGQSRGEGFSYLMLSFHDERLVSAELCRLDFDINNSINLIQHSDLSMATQEKLVGYLRS